MKDIFRRVRGALGNALVWASGWFVAGMSLGAILHIGFGFGPLTPFWPYVLNGGLNFAEMGFLTGGAFALYVGIAGRHKRLEDLSPVQFGVVGGVVAGLLVPILLGGIGAGPDAAMLTVAAFSAGLGGATAMASIKLAQRSLPDAAKPPYGLTPGREQTLSTGTGEVV